MSLLPDMVSSELLRALLAEPAAWAAIAIGAVAGTIRGITGFGAAMVMTPPLALLLGPAVAVPVTLILETFAAAPMLPAAVREARWRVLAPISIAAIACVPIGSYWLATADPDLLRRIIAAVVICFALLLLRGARYHGRQRLGTSLGLGALSGTMLGATSIGAPPVILYLLSGPDEVRVSRASLTLYVVVISAAGLVAQSLSGAITARALGLAALMAPLFVLGVVLGSRLFSRFSDQRFRQFTMVFMLLVSLGVLLA